MADGIDRIAGPKIEKRSMSQNRTVSIKAALALLILVSANIAWADCSCSGASAVKDAFDKAKKYYDKNKQCISGAGGGGNSSSGGSGGGGQDIAVNDYTKANGCMYIFNMDGSCKDAMTAAYGSGSAGSPPVPGCGNGSKMTPPGFHVTAKHESAKFNESNSLGMLDLQNQGSSARGILIHDGKGSDGATTWGCSGVGDFAKAKADLGIGSLVYNYFGAKEKDAKGCTDATGDNMKCERGRDGGGNEGESDATVKPRTQ